MAVTSSETPSQQSVLDRLLRVFTEVRPGEGATALLMALNIFFILSCYYILKPAREAFMSLEPRGAEWASYAAAIMAVLLVPIVKVYGSYAERVGRRRLIIAVTAFFALNLVVFYLLAEAQIRHLGIVFFVWLGIFNLMVVAQFWAYGNDIYTREEGKRLFPLILVGQTLGGIVGPLLARGAVSLTGQTHLMLLLAAALLLICVGLTFWIEQRTTRGPKRSTQVESESGLGPGGGFQLILQHRFLLFVALLIMVLNLVNTTGEYILRDSVFSAAQTSGQAQEVFVAQFYADFFFWVNLVCLLIQAFLVSRILKYLSVRGALFVLPCIALLGYSAIALLPVLWLVRTMKTLENALDYSLMNTLRAALYLPTSREMKYKAKQAIDTFFVRAGDVLSAAVVAGGIHLIGLRARGFALLVLLFVLAWLLLARSISREYGRLVAEGEGES